MANEKCIRDPVHNYIYLTDVEFKLIRHPLFQRLRFITQNGSAYYTYPSNKKCRFLHSLGSMKLGGDIFLNATENLSDGDVKEYLIQAYKMLDSIANNNLTIPIFDIIKEFASMNDKTFDKYGLSLHIDKSSIENEIKKEVFQMKFARAVLFQSVRLACILHDIGHFPFSHAVERAFSQYFDYLTGDQKKENQIYVKYHSKAEYVEKQIHERIGLGILQKIIPSSEKDFHKLCRHVARIILIGHSEYRNIVHPLYTIISSELDADRLDYSLRDPRSSGLELGAFDIERLLNNFTIYRENDKFEILPKVNALSSIESFYHQRFLIYKYLIYHHSKARMDEIVKEITFLLLEIYNSKEVKYDSVRRVLTDYNFGFLWEKCDEEEYYYCNENWYFTILQAIYIIIQGVSNPDDRTEKLKTLIETFIFRKTENIYSFFKRYDAYFDFMQKMYIKIKEAEDIEFGDFEKKMRGVIKDSINNNDLKELNDRLYKQDRVICLIAKTEPKVIKFLENQAFPFTSELHVAQQEKNGQKKKVPVTVFSPYLQGMAHASEKEQFFNVFIIKEGIKTDGQRRLLEKIRKEFMRFFVSKYKLCFGIE